MAQGGLQGGPSGHGVSLLPLLEKGTPRHEREPWKLSTKAREEVALASLHRTCGHRLQRAGGGPGEAPRRMAQNASRGCHSRLVVYGI